MGFFKWLPHSTCEIQWYYTFLLTNIYSELIAMQHFELGNIAVNKIPAVCTYISSKLILTFPVIWLLTDFFTQILERTIWDSIF